MIRLLYSRLWLLGAGLVILLAVLLSVARLLAPHAAGYHDLLEQKVGELIGQRIEIGTVSVAWRGFGPRLRMGDIALRDAESGRERVRFSRGDIDVDLLVSLLRRAWYVDRLTLSGASLTVIRAEDGGLTVAGIGVPAGAEGVPGGGGADPLLAWLFAQGRLAVTDVAVDWIDRHGPRPVELRFSAVSLDMRNSGTRHQLTGSALLPELIGERFSFAIDARGDLPASQDWDARIYADGVGLHLAGLLEGAALAGLTLRDGYASARLWGEWRRGRMTRLEGIASAAGLRLDGTRADAAPAVEVDAAAGRFAWRREDDGWRVDVNDFTLARAGEVWPASDLGLRYRAGRDGAPGGLSLHAGYLDLGAAAGMLALSDVPSPRQAEILGRLDPRGRLRDIDLVFEGAAPAGLSLARADFEDLGLSPWERIPGMSGLDGRFVAGARGGRVDLDTVAAGVSFPRLFRAPLAVDTLRGALSWARTADGWRVSAPRLELRNEDALAHVWAGFEAPAGGAAPTLALFGDFQAESVEHISRYLPAGIMPEGTVRWLDHAILGGAVPRGTLMYYGSPAAFPFDHGDGRFRVDFDVRKGVLDYAADWPPLDQIEANVVFDGRRMEIHAADGRSLASMVTEAVVVIDDLGGHPAVLDIDGRARGPTQDVLRYLRESPLRERFGAYVADLRARGDSRLDLRLAIPLNDVSATRVDGRLSLEGSRLETIGGGFDMDRIRGELGFSESGLRAQGIEADIVGLPARVDVLTEEGPEGTRTRVNAAGRADATVLARWSRLPALGRIRGALPWEAELRIPGHDAAETRSGLAIAVDLTEADLDLPPPLRKPAGEPLRLQIDAAVPHAGARPVLMRLGDRLSGVFDVDDGLRLRRGELRLGAGAARLPDRDGLRLAGRLERLSYSEWAEVLAGGAPAAGGVTSAETPAVTGLDLSVDEAEFFGLTCHQAHIAGEGGAPGWELQVDSAELRGGIAVPADPQLPWVMDLDRLYLVAPPEETAAAEEAAMPARMPDPRELPAVRIRSRDFRYNDIAFGSLDLAASHQESGLRLDRLLLASRHMRIDARGDWVVTEAGQSSAFSIKFDSDDFGAALTRLGYAGTIDDGKGQIDINASWDGPPTAFALEQLDGSMDMKVEDGRLLEVEPGAGRIFGLLSLQYLPRRLSLDFSDFFRKGFSFDRIRGNFVIKDGRASTHDLFMDGPAAKITVDGDIDLAARTYDQTVVVTPSVTAGLPVAGAVAGGVGVGAVILLMEKMLRPNIERLTRITYRVTGGWSDPVIERLQDAERPDNR